MAGMTDDIDTLMFAVFSDPNAGKLKYFLY